MERLQPSGPAGPRKKQPRLLVLICLCSIWWFLRRQSTAFLTSDNTEVEVLRQKLYESNVMVKELEAALDASSIVEKSTPDIEENAQFAIPSTGVDDLPTAIKHLFDDLATNVNDTQVKPLILQNVIRREGDGLNKTGIVLATQLSSKKFSNLLTQLKYWNGPASVAIYIQRSKDIDKFFEFIKVSREVVRNTTFHLVLEKTELLYPTNLLRSVALEAIETHYFVTMDVDLIPLPEDCHGKLLSSFSEVDIANKKKTLFILPAFSLFPKKRKQFATPDMLPLTKANVIDLHKNKSLAQFWKRWAPQGHGPTHNEIWYNAENVTRPTYDISISFKESTSYEPYVLGFKPGIPRYWEGKSTVSSSLLALSFAVFSLSLHSVAPLYVRLSRLWAQQDQLQS